MLTIEFTDIDSSFEFVLHSLVEFSYLFKYLYLSNKAF